MIEATLERVNGAFASSDPRVIVRSTRDTADGRVSFVRIFTEEFDFTVLLLRCDGEDGIRCLPKKIHVTLSDAIQSTSGKRIAHEATVRLDDAAGRIVWAQRLLVSG